MPLVPGHQALLCRAQIELVIQNSLESRRRIPAFLGVAKPETQDVSLLPDIVTRINPAGPRMQHGVVVDKEHVSGLWLQPKAVTLSGLLNDVYGVQFLGAQRRGILRVRILWISTNKCGGIIDLDAPALHSDDRTVECSDDFFVGSRSAL
jgi:hypothetical protein